MNRILLFCIIFLSVSGLAQEKRLALVIGNSAYEYGGVLRNPVNDAMAMKRALTVAGFEVIEKFNLDQGEMKRVIDIFGLQLKDFDVGLFFYAGHGIQAKGNNYLIPVDANLKSENDVEYDCVNIGRVLGKMESSNNKVNIIILDACRNNPFERTWTRSVQGKGLATMDAPIGSILAYATAPGKTASDGLGQNGLYTSVLTRFISSSGLSIEEVFKQVRIHVVTLSEGSQVPWESTSLMGDFYFINEDTQPDLEPTALSKKETPDETASIGMFTDSRDYQQYSWVRIGEQVWMAENLNYLTSNGSWCYENKKTNCEKYGRLYNWITALDVCPDGWHLPSDTEWKQLEIYLGMSQEEADVFSNGSRGTYEGGKLKENGTKHWNSPNTGANNLSGFKALPGGMRFMEKFIHIEGRAYFWSSTGYDSYSAIFRTLYWIGATIDRLPQRNTYGMSVRCVKD